MAVTRHGHQIPLSPAENLAGTLPKARCGGPGLCKDCNQDLAFWHQNHAPKPSPEPSPLLRYFKYQHLPPHLALVSKSYAELAEWTDDILPSGSEKTVALRKLLEAKDAAVRSALDGV